MIRLRKSLLEPDAHIVAHLLEADDQLRAELADPGGVRRAAVLADIKRRAGGQTAKVDSRVPALVGAGAPLAKEEQEESAPAPTPLRRRPMRKPRWYLPAALAADVVGVGVPAFAAVGATLQANPVLTTLSATAVWVGVRGFSHRYTARTLGESRSVLPVLRDWCSLLGILAMVHVITGADVEPVVMLLALSGAPIITAGSMKLTSQHLTSLRREAQVVNRALVVGEPAAVDNVVAHLAARTDHAYVAVGAVPVGKGRTSSGVPAPFRISSVPSSDSPDDWVLVRAAAESLSADLVLVAPNSALSGERLRRLSWALHDAGLPLAVSPGLTDVFPDRMRTDSVAGLALIHVSPPRRRDVSALSKAAIDRVGAVMGLFLLAPLLGLLALAVRANSSGPVLYRHTRVGLNGAPFTMLKFRTMAADAEQRKADVIALGEQDEPLFKVRRDPRVTRVGRFLRRSSLDELPQLLNVLRGDMSLVGPRPPLPEEAAQYTEPERRRLTVKPGLTGLWQISGRSDLSWDESVALDLRYADNWSIGLDLEIIGRTLWAIAEGRGAY